MYDYTYYDYGYDYGYEAATAATGLAAFGVGLLVFWLIAMAVSALIIVCTWKVFKKAGKPGWAALIPVYNIIVMIEIAELPMWYIALYFVPGANIYAMIKINIEIAHKFGKSTGFGVGMALLAPVFLAMLAFGKNNNFVGSQNVTQPTYQQPVQPNPQVQPQNVQPVTPVQPVEQVNSFVVPTPVVEQPMSAPVQPTQPAEQVNPFVVPTPVVEQPMSAPVQPTQPVEQVNPFVVPTPAAEPLTNQNMGPTFCTNCGNALMPNAKFCTKCGKQI